MIFLKYDDKGSVVSFYKPGDIVGVSNIYDFSKKNKENIYDIEALDKDNEVIFILEDHIEQLTDKERGVFNWILENIRSENTKKI